jgi:hypothetical protein
MRASRVPRSLALAVLVAACGGEVEAERAPTPADAEHHPRFVGTWVVEEAAARGGYAGELVELTADGRFERVVTIEYSGEATDIGLVARPGSRVSCRLGDRWWSDGPENLLVEGACSDQIARTIALRLPVGDSNDDPREPNVVHVGGEPGWQRGGRWGWAMRRCASAACRKQWNR